MAKTKLSLKTDKEFSVTGGDAWRNSRGHPLARDDFLSHSLLLKRQVNRMERHGVWILLSLYFCLLTEKPTEIS